jgi:hypothetical protein
LIHGRENSLRSEIMRSKTVAPLSDASGIHACHDHDPFIATHPGASWVKMAAGRKQPWAVQDHRRQSAPNGDGSTPRRAVGKFTSCRELRYGA